MGESPAAGFSCTILLVKEIGKPKEMGELAFATMVLRTLGPMRTSRLIGFAFLWRLNGLRSFRDVSAWIQELRQRGGPSRPVVYRVLADLREVRHELAKREQRPIEDMPTAEELAIALTEGRDPTTRAPLT
jgi:hypothetical protein